MTQNRGAGGNPYVTYPLVPSLETHGLGYDGLLQEYYSWLLCAEPKYHGYPTEPLFCHGTISYNYDDKTRGYTVERPINIRGNIEGEALDLSERITTGTLIVVDILSSFFFPNDVKENGDIIRTRRDCYLECSEDYLYEREYFAGIRRIGESRKEERPIDVIHVGPVPINVEVDPVNPYLGKFAGSPQKLAPGPKSGYAASYMSIFRIEKEGEYILEYGGEGNPPYHSQACLQVIVKKNDAVPTFAATFTRSRGKKRRLRVDAKFLPH
jgi:hypothetical protein